MRAAGSVGESRRGGVGYTRLQPRPCLAAQSVPFTVPMSFDLMYDEKVDVPRLCVEGLVNRVDDEDEE